MEATGTNGGGGVIVDVTDAYALISVQGPQSRALLQKLTGPHIVGLFCPYGRSILTLVLTDTNLSNEAFPFGASRELEIGFVKARCSIIIYIYIYIYIYIVG